MKLCCINCGANVKYKIGTNLVYCEQCGSDSNIEEYRNKNIEYDVTQYCCSSCGAKIEILDNSIVNYCNYCGSSNFNITKNDYKIEDKKIIPFKYTKNDFIKKFEDFISKNTLSNKEYFKVEKITKILGLYVPVFVTDCDIKFVSKGVLEYNSNNKLALNKKYNYKLSSNYKANITYDTISSLQDYILDNLMPFDVSETVDFSPYYFAGLSAALEEKNNNQKLKNISNKISNFLSKYIKNNFDNVKSVEPLNNDISLTPTNKNEYYFPIWLCSYKFENKIYSFAMNGQTGKIISTLPKDEEKFESRYNREKTYSFIDNTKKYFLYGTIAFLIIAGAASKANKSNDTNLFKSFLLYWFVIIIAIVIVKLILETYFHNKESKETLNNRLSNIDYDMSNYKITKDGETKKEIFS